MLGLEGLGLGWWLRSWNRLDRDQLGIDEIGWELEWINRSGSWGGDSMNVRMIKRVGKLEVGVIGKIE